MDMSVTESQWLAERFEAHRTDLRAVAAMPDRKEDLAALRIEREPDRPTRRWVGWMLLLIVAAAGGVAAWRWATREQLVEVETPSSPNGRPGRRPPSSTPLDT
jgi:hypothetical protein